VAKKQVKATDYLGLLQDTKKTIKRAQKLIKDSAQTSNAAIKAMAASAKRFLEKFHKESDKLHNLWLQNAYYSIPRLSEQKKRKARKSIRQKRMR